MAESMKDAMRKAYDKNGQEVPTTTKTSGVKPAKRQPASAAKSNTQHPQQLRQPSKPNHGNCSRSLLQQTTKPPELPDPPLLQPHKLKTPAPAAPKLTADDYRVEVMAKAGIAFDIDPPKKTSLLDADSRQGHTTQCHGATWSDEREIVLGLDFGTSSVKVVIGDNIVRHTYCLKT